MCVQAKWAKAMQAQTRHTNKRTSCLSNAQMQISPQSKDCVWRDVCSKLHKLCDWCLTFANFQRAMFHCICGRAYSLPLVCDFKETLRQRGVESEEMKATCTRRLSLTSRLCCVIDTHTRKWTITQIQHVSVECMWSVGTAFRTNECVREITQPVARMLNEVWTKNRLQR